MYPCMCDISHDFIPVIMLKYGVPVDIVFQLLAKVQYQTTRTESFFD